MRIRSPRKHRQDRDNAAGVSTPAPNPPAPPRRVTSAWPGHQIMDDPVTARVLYQVWSGDPAVVVQSPPGAGKTRLVTLLAAALAHRAGLRVALAAQTKAQALEIAHRLGSLTDSAVLLWKKDAPAPGAGAVRALPANKVSWPSTGGGIVIAVTARWLFVRPEQLGADVMLVDEAWQCTYADLGALGALAPQVVCVGDPGQIAPVVTGETRRWAGSQTAPNLPAPAALLAAHGEAVGVVRLRHTWRLGPATTGLVQPTFYPELPFTTRRADEHLSDQSGNLLPELAQRPIALAEGPADPALVGACADRVEQLLDTMYVAGPQPRPLTAADIAVVVPHVAQAAAVRAVLASHPQLLVGTANSLQGLERPAVVVVHPLAGYRSAESFALDPGRLCVMLSRHRTHATVLHDTAAPGVLSADEPDDGGLNARLLAAIAALPPA